jgi:hypothetical protein
MLPRLIAQVILSHTFELLALSMIVDHCVNADLLSMVFPLSLLLYGALDSPRPAPVYFDVMLLYTLFLITAKALYQLPIFCGSPPFHFRSTNPATLQEPYPLAYCFDQRVINDPQFVATLPTRADYVLGIHKYTSSGHAHESALEELGIFVALLPDLAVLVILIVHRQVVRERGDCVDEQHGFRRRLVPPLRESKRGTDQHIESFIVCRERRYCRSLLSVCASLSTLPVATSPCSRAHDLLLGIYSSSAWCLCLAGSLSVSVCGLWLQPASPAAYSRMHRDQPRVAAELLADRGVLCAGRRYYHCGHDV